MRLTRISAVVSTVCILLAPAARWAEPVVTGVTGDFRDGRTLTITGYNFGTKDPAGPVLFDDVVNTQAYVDRGLADGDPISSRLAGCPDCPWYLAFPTGGGVRYGTPGRCGADGATYRAVGRGFLKLEDLGEAIAGRLFVNWWMRTSHEFGPDAAHFLVRVGTGLDTESGFAIWAVNGLRRLPDADHDGVPEPVTVDWDHWGGESGSWTRLQLWIDSSDGIDLGHGKVRAVTAGDTIHNVDCWASESLNHLMQLGPDLRPYDVPVDVVSEWTEIYVDTTFAHVFVSHLPDPAFESEGEIQIALEWSPSRISVKAAPGCLPDNGPLFLFVVDRAGARSVAGFEFRVDGDGTGQP